MNSLGFRNRNPSMRNSRTFRARNERGYGRRAGVAGNFERKCRRRTLEKLSKAMNLAVELEQMGRLCPALPGSFRAARPRSAEFKFRASRLAFAAVLSSFFILKRKRAL